MLFRSSGKELRDSRRREDVADVLGQDVPDAIRRLKMEGSAISPDVPVKAIEEGRLPCTIPAEQAVYLPLLKGETDVPQDLLCVETLRQLLYDKTSCPPTLCFWRQPWTDAANGALY